MIERIMGMPGLEISDLYMGTPNCGGLNGLSLCAAPGTIHFLTDEHAEELHTLFSLIEGELTPDRGIIRFNGSPALHAACFSGHAPETLFPEFSLAENIFFNQTGSESRRSALRLDRLQLNYRCRCLLESFSLDWEPQGKLLHMGLAQQQLVALLRIYVTQKPLVLLDEPSALFTDVEQAVAYRIIRRMRDEGRCLLISSSKMQEILAYGDVLSIIDRGTLVRTVPLRGEITEEELLSLLSGTCRRDRYPRSRSSLGKVAFSVSGLAACGVLQDISFHLREGEILGVTGLAGSGRSMLCRSLFGMEDCRMDSLTIHGRTARINDPAAAIALGLAYLPEKRMDGAIFENMTVRDNLSLSSLHRFKHTPVSLDPVYEQYLTDSYLKKLSISPSQGNHAASGLSQGASQKLILSRFMMSGARIYIIDEPTGGMDVPSKIDFYNMLADLRNKGCSILLVSSDMEELLGMCDRILVISGGRISLECKAADATKELLLQAASR